MAPKRRSRLRASSGSRESLMRVRPFLTLFVLGKGIDVWRDAFAGLVVDGDIAYWKSGA